MRVSRVFLGVCLAVGGAFACGPQTDYKEKSDSGKMTTKVTTSGGKIASTAGSELAVPAGALAVGTELSVVETTAPAEFAATAAAVASLPLDVAATGADGKPVLQAQQPMTVSLTLGGATLALADRADSNLCVLLKTKSAAFYVWRYADLVHDAAARKVAVSTLFFGVFQVVFCGQDVLPGFTDSKQQVAAANVSAGGPGGSVAMAIPEGFAPTPGVGRHCLAILDSMPSDGQGGDDDTSVIAVAEVASGSAATITATGVKPRAGAKEVFALLHLIAPGSACPLGLGTKLKDTQNAVGAVGLLAWSLDLGVIAAGQQIAGTVGPVGPFPTGTVEIGVGAPGFANEAELPGVSEPIACIDLDIQDGAKTMLPANLSFGTGVGRVNGEAAHRAVVALPPNGVVTKHSLTLRVGESCKSFELGPQDAPSGKPYEIRLHGATLASSYYFAPVSMKIVNSNPLLGTSNGCLHLYPVGGAPPPGGPLRSEDTWGNVTVALSGGVYPVLLPYFQDPTQHVDGKPSYDLVIDLLEQGKTCENRGSGTLPPMSLPARPLNPEILVEIK